MLLDLHRSRRSYRPHPPYVWHPCSFHSCPPVPESINPTLILKLIQVLERSDLKLCLNLMQFIFNAD